MPSSEVAALGEGIGVARRSIGVQNGFENMLVQRSQNLTIVPLSINGDLSVRSPGAGRKLCPFLVIESRVR